MHAPPTPLVTLPSQPALPSSSSTSTTSSSTSLVLSTLPLLDPTTSHTFVVYIFGGPQETRPVQRLYIEVFLQDEYSVDCVQILQNPSSALFAEAALYLYYQEDLSLAERYPPELLDWETNLRQIFAEHFDATSHQA